MEAKEKAMDLIEKFLECQESGEFVIMKDNARQSALICCDEILNIELTHPQFKDDLVMPHIVRHRTFWKNVKTEIEKL